MYNFKQGVFKKTGTTENNDGCYESATWTNLCIIAFEKYACWKCLFACFDCQSLILLDFYPQGLF